MSKVDEAIERVIEAHKGTRTEKFATVDPRWTAFAHEVLGLLSALVEQRPSTECTGVSASWCPVHGDCGCPRLDTGEREEEARDCPLHGVESAHGEELEPMPRTPLAPADRVPAEELAEVARLDAAYRGKDAQAHLNAREALAWRGPKLLPKLTAEVTALRAEATKREADYASTERAYFNACRDRNTYKEDRDRALNDLDDMRDRLESLREKARAVCDSEGDALDDDTVEVNVDALEALRAEARKP